MSSGRYQKRDEAPARSSGWTTAISSRLHTAVKSKLTGLGLSVGGVGASVTAVATHQVSPLDITVVGGTVVAGLVAKCVDSYIERQPAIIEARGKAEEAKIKAQTKAQASDARMEILRILVDKLIEDPANAGHIERVLERQDLTALAQTFDLTGEEVTHIASLLADPHSRERFDQIPATGGEFPRPVVLGQP